jgi:hypothetical protein
MKIYSCLSSSDTGLLKREMIPLRISVSSVILLMNSSGFNSLSFSLFAVDAFCFEIASCFALFAFLVMIKKFQANLSSASGDTKFPGVSILIQGQDLANTIVLQGPSNY